MARKRALESTSLTAVVFPMPDKTLDMFSVDPSDPLTQWGGLIHDLEECKPSLLKTWLLSYEEWKGLYQRFRDYEQRSFYTGDVSGEIPVLSETILRFHRRAIFTLLSSGERCMDILIALPLQGGEAQDRLEWKRKMECLLDSLQEAVDLWHPVNRDATDVAEFVKKFA